MGVNGFLEGPITTGAYGGEYSPGTMKFQFFRIFSNCFFGRFGPLGFLESNGGGPGDHFSLSFIFWDALGPELWAKNHFDIFENSFYMFFLYNLCFSGSLGLGTFSIGFLVSSYVYFIIRTTIQDPLESIYDQKTKIFNPGISWYILGHSRIS